MASNLPEVTQDQECYSGNTWSEPIVTDKDIGEVTKAWFTVRKSPQGDALIQLNDDDDPGNFTVANNLITVKLLPADTEGLPGGNWYYDLKVEHDTGTETYQRGRFRIVPCISASTIPA